MGDGQTARWGRVAALLAVALFAVGLYQLTSRPPTADAPPTTADAPTGDTAEAAPTVAVVRTGPPSWVVAASAPPLSVRLGLRVVGLRGPGLVQTHRESSAVTLGRTDRGWLVRVISRACHGQTDTQVSYGTARRSGRFTVWDPVHAHSGTSWRSPDQALLLVRHGPRLELRRTATGQVVGRFPAAP